MFTKENRRGIRRLAETASVRQLERFEQELEAVVGRGTDPDTRRFAAWIIRVFKEERAARAEVERLCARHLP